MPDPEPMDIGEQIAEALFRALGVKAQRVKACFRCAGSGIVVRETGYHCCLECDGRGTTHVSVY